MLHNVIMPKLGESVTEGTIVKWLVKPGDTIKQYDNLLEVETAKVVAEVPSTISGTIKEILCKEGDTVKVGTVICTIEATGESTSTELTDTERVETKNENVFTKETVKVGQGSSNNVQNSVNLSNNLSNKGGGGNQGRFSPAVLALAQENGIDLQQIKGTGFEGRVTRKDVLNFINNNKISAEDVQFNEQKSESKSINNNNITTNNTVSVDSSLENKPTNGDKLIPLSAVRKAIAKKMVESVSNIPHAWLSIEVDATNLVNIRNRMKNEFLVKEGYPITYFAFFIVEIVKALQEFPLLNSEWKGNSILLKKDINISIAVAVGNSLFVPVIKNADTKNVKGIAKEIFDLAQKAKNNTLTASDMQGGTFTINNTGSFGSISSMGIINYPQAAILQVESIVKRPIIQKDNSLSFRDMINLSLSIDHRIVDGLIAGNFLKTIKTNIEKM